MSSKRSDAQADKYQVITWEQYNQDVKILLEKIRKSNIQFDNIYGIPRGGLVLAVHLSHLLNKPLTNDYSISSLIVDDVSDTGKTLKRFSRGIIATLYRKDHTITEPTFYARTINKWIIYPWEIL